jgi:hypothetical protein
MNKYSCTKSISEEIYYATLIAETSQQANKWRLTRPIRNGWSGNGGWPRDWSVRVLETNVDGPARIIECGYHEA